MSAEPQVDVRQRAPSENEEVPLAEAYSSAESGFRIMYAIDALVLFSLMVAITVVRFGLTWPNYSIASYLGLFGVATAIHVVVAYFGGMYDREYRLGSPANLTRASKVSAIAVLIDAAGSLGADQFIMPRFNLAIFAVLGALALTLNRWIARKALTRRYGRPRVLLVGSPDDIDLIEQHLDDTDRDAIVVGKRSSERNLLTAVEDTQASEVLLLSGCELSSIYPEPLNELEARRIGVYHRLEPSDTLLGLAKTRQIAGVPFVAVKSHALPPSRAQFKRILDLIYLTIALPLIALVGLFAMVYSLIVAGRPIFYRQERIGRKGRPFTLVKLRTMHPNAEKHTGAVLADSDDPRVIPRMRWVRATRLDELPQIFNVLKGDMSLVGPRPERPELASDFATVIPGYERRHDIRPGITGLAQVHGRYHTDPGYKLGHDLQYLVNWTPVLDLQILLRTIAVVLTRRF